MEKRVNKKYFIAFGFLLAGLLLSRAVSYLFGDLSSSASLSLQAFLTWLEDIVPGQSNVTVEAVRGVLVALFGGAFYAALIYIADKYRFLLLLPPVLAAAVFYGAFLATDIVYNYEYFAGYAGMYAAVSAAALLVTNAVYLLFYPLLRGGRRLFKGSLLPVAGAAAVFILARVVLSVAAAGVFIQIFSAISPEEAGSASFSDILSQAGDLLLSILPDVVLGVAFYLLVTLTPKARLQEEAQVNTAELPEASQADEAAGLGAQEPDAGDAGETPEEKPDGGE